MALRSLLNRVSDPRHHRAGNLPETFSESRAAISGSPRNARSDASASNGFLPFTRRRAFHPSLTARAVAAEGPRCAPSLPRSPGTSSDRSASIRSRPSPHPGTSRDRPASRGPSSPQSAHMRCRSIASWRRISHRRLEASHHRHLHVHQHQIEIFLATASTASLRFPPHHGVRASSSSCTASC